MPNDLEKLLENINNMIVYLEKELERYRSAQAVIASEVGGILPTPASTSASPFPLYSPSSSPPSIPFPAPPIKEPHHSININSSSSKAQIVTFLREHGPSTRKEVLEGTGMANGSFCTATTDKRIFAKSTEHGGPWSLVEGGGEAPAEEFLRGPRPRILSGSAKARVIVFLREHGPSTRKEISEGGDIVYTQLGSILADKRIFIKPIDRGGPWYLKEATGSFVSKTRLRSHSLRVQQFIDLLKSDGPLTQEEVMDKTGLAIGAISDMFSLNKEIFKQSDDGKWSFQESTYPVPGDENLSLDSGQDIWPDKVDMTIPAKKPFPSDLELGDKKVSNPFADRFNKDE